MASHPSSPFYLLIIVDMEAEENALSNPSQDDEGHGREKRARYHHALQLILRKLEHMDLTGKIDGIAPVMNAHGGYCDVFSAVILGTNTKVAVKRMRAHVFDDLEFSKVSFHATANILEA